MSGNVQILGLRELGQALRALPAEIGSKRGGPLLKALRKTAAPIQKSARARVRKKSGQLEKNIITARAKHPENFGATESVEVTVRYKAKPYKNNRTNRRKGRVGQTYRDLGPYFYARFLEYGTQHAPAYPFLRPAFEEFKAGIPELFKNAMAGAIEAAIRKAGLKPM